MKTINVRDIWDVQSKVQSDGNAEISIYFGEKRVVLHLNMDEVNYLVSDIWAITNRRQELLDGNKKALRGI